jgi:hypothetical protein
MKTLILSVDVGNKSTDWEVRAMGNQIMDYFNKNKSVFNVENVIIFPSKGAMKLFWLEGDPASLDDVKSLESIRDRLKPVLEVAMGIKRKNPGVKRVKKRKRGKGGKDKGSQDS